MLIYVTTRATAAAVTSVGLHSVSPMWFFQTSRRPASTMCSRALHTAALHKLPTCMHHRGITRFYAWKMATTGGIGERGAASGDDEELILMGDSRRRRRGRCGARRRRSMSQPCPSWRPWRCAGTGRRGCVRAGACRCAHPQSRVPPGAPQGPVNARTPDWSQRQQTVCQKKPKF